MILIFPLRGLNLPTEAKATLSPHQHVRGARFNEMQFLKHSVNGAEFYIAKCFHKLQPSERCTLVTKHSEKENNKKTKGTEDSFLVMIQKHPDQVMRHPVAKSNVFNRPFMTYAFRSALMFLT